MIYEAFTLRHSQNPKTFILGRKKGHRREGEKEEREAKYVFIAPHQR
jgi:hypothetical protein